MLEVSSPTPCSKQGQLWDPTRLLRALSCWVFKTSKDGDCTAILGICSTACLSSWCKHSSLYYTLPVLSRHPLKYLSSTFSASSPQARPFHLRREGLHVHWELLTFSESPAPLQSQGSAVLSRGFLPP